MQNNIVGFEAPDFLIETYRKELDKGAVFSFNKSSGEKAENIKENETYEIVMEEKDGNKKTVYFGGLRCDPKGSGRLEPDGVCCFFNTNDLKYRVTFEKHMNGKMVDRINYASPDEEQLNLLTFYEDNRPAHFFYNEEQIVDYVYGIVSDPFDKKSNPEMDKTLIYKDYFRLGIWEKLFSCCNAKAMKKSEIYEMIEKCFSKCEESNPSFRIGYFRDEIKKLNSNLNYEYLKQNLQEKTTTFNLEKIDNLSRCS